VDQHGDALRARYVAFIHDLGQQRVGGKPLVEALSDDDGFSYWWMTHLAEKSPFKSPRIYDCLRLMGLEQFFQDEGWPCKLSLRGGDAEIAKTVADFCANAGIDFYKEGAQAGVEMAWLARLHQKLPWRIKGILSLRHWLRRWPSRKVSGLPWFSESFGLLFCSYFFNLDTQMAGQGQFHSRQWEILPEQLQQDGWQLKPYRPASCGTSPR